MQPCRECHHLVSEDALACPQCGAPRPSKPSWTGYGFEYKSRTHIGSLPLVHISLKYRPNMTPVVAKGVIAIGQFAVGIVTIAQFGIGIACISQFALGVWALGQFCLAWSFVGQMGIYMHNAIGMLIISAPQLLDKLLT